MIYADFIRTFMRSLYVPLALLIGLLLVAAGMAVLVQPEKGSAAPGLRSFNSYAELNSYLDRNSGSKGLVSDPSTEQMASGDASQSHSTTNVQVSDVQEEDRVLTDGTYIYSAGQTAVDIVKGVPASDMKNLTALNMSRLLDLPVGSSVYVMGLYLIDHDLIVICQVSNGSQDEQAYAVSATAPADQVWTTRTTVSVFDVADPGVPLLEHTVGISGSFTTSRAQGNDLYIFSTQYAWDYAGGGSAIPAASHDGNNTLFEPGTILYDPANTEVSCFLNLVRLNVPDIVMEEKSFLTGYSSVLYMSENSIFVTYPHYAYAYGVQSPATAGDVSVSSSTQTRSYTTIFKIDITGKGLDLAAAGTVRGTVVDRYAIDERDGYLRIATTDFTNGTETLVSVMSSNLSLVGQIGGIGMGESMQSSRYINDTLYLVTFRQVDPLYAIDLTVPNSPRILGELTMPGFSTYLHPVDDTHLIGLGFEDHSMKVSLYNVSDRTRPVEEQRLLLSNFSYSPALYDPHAVTYDPVRSRLIVPVSGYDGSKGQYECAAYVFNTSGGISLIGTAGSNNSGGVDRTLYIGDSLYVCSQDCISAYAMTDLSYRGDIVLGTPEPYWYGFYPGNGTAIEPMTPEIG
jgi:inhibitor of cysteine peptidase